MKTNKIIILFIVFIPITYNLFAQDSIKNSKWSIGLNISPDFTYRMVPNHNVPDRYVFESYNFLIKDQIPKMGFHLTLSAGYRILNNFEIRSGLNFNFNGYNTKYFYETVYGQSHEFIGIDTFQIKNTFYHLGIPVWFIGKINCSKKISIKIGAGITTNFYIKEKEKWIWIKSPISNYDNSVGTPKLKGFNDIIMTKVGIEYGLNANLSLNISPNFNYFIGQYFDLDARDGNNGINFYSAGIEFGLNYNFDRKMKK